MNIQRFKAIIRYNKKNMPAMEMRIKDFYDLCQLGSYNMLNLMQVVRPLFTQKGFFLIELPFADREIGAICYKGDCFGYTFLNTSLPKVNVNFVLCHELYHIYYQRQDFKQKVELLDQNYCEDENEFAANLFAGMILMPENSFRAMFYKFKNEEVQGNLAVIVKIMSYFQVPYMAALIRCYELELIDSGQVLYELLGVEPDEIKRLFRELWLDESILEATKRDDYDKFEFLVQSRGIEYQEKEYINERTLTKALENMKELYKKIKGD